MRGRGRGRGRGLVRITSKSPVRSDAGCKTPSTTQSPAFPPLTPDRHSPKPSISPQMEPVKVPLHNVWKARTKTTSKSNSPSISMSPTRSQSSPSAIPELPKFTNNFTPIHKLPKKRKPYQPNTNDVKSLLTQTVHNALTKRSQFAHDPLDSPSLPEHFEQHEPDLSRLLPMDPKISEPKKPDPSQLTRFEDSDSSTERNSESGKPEITLDFGSLQPAQPIESILDPMSVKFKMQQNETSENGENENSYGNKGLDGSFAKDQVDEIHFQEAMDNEFLQDEDYYEEQLYEKDYEKPYDEPYKEQYEEPYEDQFEESYEERYEEPEYAADPDLIEENRSDAFSEENIASNEPEYFPEVQDDAKDDMEVVDSDVKRSGVGKRMEDLCDFEEMPAIKEGSFFSEVMQVREVDDQGVTADDELQDSIDYKDMDNPLTNPLAAPLSAQLEAPLNVSMDTTLGPVLDRMNEKMNEKDFFREPVLKKKENGAGPKDPQNANLLQADRNLADVRISLSPAALNDPLVSNLFIPSQKSAEVPMRFRSKHAQGIITQDSKQLEKKKDKETEALVKKLKDLGQRQIEEDKVNGDDMGSETTEENAATARFPLDQAKVLKASAPEFIPGQVVAQKKSNDKITGLVNSFLGKFTVEQGHAWDANLNSGAPEFVPEREKKMKKNVSWENSMLNLEQRIIEKNSSAQIEIRSFIVEELGTNGEYTDKERQQLFGLIQERNEEITSIFHKFDLTSDVQVLKKDIRSFLLATATKPEENIEIWIPRYNLNGKLICKNFLKGECLKRAGSCRLNHISSEEYQEILRLNAVHLQTGRGDWMNNQESEEPLHYEVCRKFYGGECRFGTNCHYSHINFLKNFNKEQKKRRDSSPTEPRQTMQPRQQMRQQNPRANMPMRQRQRKQNNNIAPQMNQQAFRVMAPVVNGFLHNVPPPRSQQIINPYSNSQPVQMQINGILKPIPNPYSNQQVPINVPNVAQSPSMPMQIRQKVKPTLLPNAYGPRHKPISMVPVSPKQTAMIITTIKKEGWGEVQISENFLKQ